MVTDFREGGGGAEAGLGGDFAVEAEFAIRRGDAFDLGVGELLLLAAAGDEGAELASVYEEDAVAARALEGAVRAGA